MPKGRKQTTERERRRKKIARSIRPGGRERENVSQSEKLFCHTARLVSSTFLLAFSLAGAQGRQVPNLRDPLAHDALSEKFPSLFSPALLISFLQREYNKKKRHVISLCRNRRWNTYRRGCQHAERRTFPQLNSVIVRFREERRLGSFYVILCEQYKFTRGVQFQFYVTPSFMFTFFCATHQKRNE